MTAPHVLYPLNISNPNRLSSDSGWIFVDLLAPSMMDAGASITVAAPMPIADRRAAFIPVTGQNTKYRVRFTQNVAWWASLIRRTRPDVVVANQVEAAPAIRTALLETGSNALVAGYCHYLPFTVQAGCTRVDPTFDARGLGDPVRLAYMAGLAACDRILVHSARAASWVTVAAAQSGLDVTDRLRAVPAPRDERLVRDPDAVSCAQEPVGIYNHRLYAHYGTDQFVRLATELVRRTSVKVRVMDLMGVRHPDRVALDDSPERAKAQLAVLQGVEVASDGGDRSRYRHLLGSSRFGIAPFREGCPWSMSVIDCQGMGLPVIAPRMGWMADHVDQELLIDTPEQAVDLAVRLVDDAEFYKLHAKRAAASTVPFAPATVARRYLEAVA